MSRCYPYPPPGYQKKAQLPDVNVPAKVLPKEKKKNKEKEKEKKVKDLEKEKEKKSKEAIHKQKDSTGEKEKEKHRDRDRRDKNRKEKRKKDGETNGIGHAITDKDPRSSKLQRTSRANNVLHSNEENGRVRETTISAAVACPRERDGRDAAKPPDGVVGSASHPPTMYIKKDQQSNGKVGPNLPPVVLSTALGGSPPDVEAVPPTRPSNHNHLIESSRKPNFSSQRPQELPEFSICDNLPKLATWSTLDDEDWLLPSSERVRSMPKARVDEDASQEVWAEAIYLSSVDMYALPYVVPY